MVRPDNMPRPTHKCLNIYYPSYKYFQYALDIISMNFLFMLMHSYMIKVGFANSSLVQIVLDVLLGLLHI